MKKFLSMAAFLLMAFTTGLQPVPDARLIDFLGKQQVEKMLKENPQLVYYYNYYLDHSWYLAKLAPAKRNSSNIEGELSLPLLSTGEVNTEKLNVLKLDVKRYYDHPSYYRIKDSDYLLIFRSEKDFNERYNEYRRSLGLIKY